ncbi:MULTISPECIES: SIR2 family protein [Rhizobium]|uniref:SIR2 family protein n=1 Tax=Rhizobium TaxID=379 RepID=UPI001030DEF2|nr:MULTISPECIES: SIR2 family protein [Rhizobium]TBF24866.1 SIR2 family protein [Rhizobium leguminosarum]WSH48581.1 SIR2 family protein [Rhizobium johnstonii]
MGYWDTIPASAGNIRHYTRATGWTAYDDVKDEDGRVTAHGSHRAVELALSIALNASNLAILSGAGSSFCAKNNETGSLQAPGMSDLWDAVVADVTQPIFDSVIALIPKANAIGKNIEKLLTQSKIYVELFDDANAVKVGEFIAAAEKAIAKRVDFVKESTDFSAHAAIIRKIARRGIRKPRAKIFTTNYDLCFEYAAQTQRFTVIDGFSHSIPQVYDSGHFAHDVVRREAANDGPNYIENVFQLYKLHGSLDWRRKEAEIVRSRDNALGTPILIYPRDSKYQQAFEPPYLDMMGAFQTAIREPDTTLIISGFGFNDDHIVRPIFAAIEANMTLRVVVCDVAFLADAALDGAAPVLPRDYALQSYANESFKKFKRLVDIGDERITILNGRFEDLALAVPDLVAQTERERHAERIKVLREPSTDIFQ